MPPTSRSSAGDDRPLDGVEQALAALLPHWRAYWPDVDADAMAADARERLAAAVATWRLDGVRALPGGNVALVVAARRGGRGVVVKLHARGHDGVAELTTEGRALEHWAPTGAAVALLGRRDEGLTLLLEQCVPGTPLVASAPWEVALEVLGQLTGRLHRAGAAPDGVVTRREQAPRWSALLAADPRAVAEQDLVDVLVGNARPGDDVLLHDDLHGGNALRAGAGDTWRVIDPHGVGGDRHGDVWAVLEPLAPALPTGPDAARRAATDRVHRYARAAGLDPARTASWVRLRARVVAADLRPPDDPELGAQDAAWVLRLHALADALRP